MIILVIFMCLGVNNAAFGQTWSILFDENDQGQSILAAERCAGSKVILDVLGLLSVESDQQHQWNENSLGSKRSKKTSPAVTLSDYSIQNNATQFLRFESLEGGFAVAVQDMQGGIGQRLDLTFKKGNCLPASAYVTCANNPTAEPEFFTELEIASGRCKHNTKKKIESLCAVAKTICDSLDLFSDLKIGATK
jgi:hypothetical protein